MRVARWLISPQNQSPLCGAFQDGLIGLAELTKDGIHFNKWHAMNVLADIFTPDLDYDFPDQTYTNRNLVSRLLPKINLLNREPTMYKAAYAPLLKYNPQDIKVNIIRGELKSGILDKSTSGQGVMGSIFHIIANEYGNDKSLETIYNLQQIVHRFFLYHGFTVGIRDINISNTAMKEVKRRVASMILESRKITQRLNTGKLIAPIGMTLYEFNEIEQQNALTAGDDFVNPIFADIDLESNHMARLILTGSKGKVPNFIDLNGALGTLTINGKRFGPQAGWGRTSPFFVRYDTEPAASGFISASYREGIQSDVYPFVAGQARHGLISNALSTSITGYQNRISIKNLETILVDNLRKATKGRDVVQALYAECGIDPSKTEKIKFPTIMMSNAQLEEQYHTKLSLVDKKYRSQATEAILDDEFEQIKTDRQTFREAFMLMEDHNPKEYVMSDSRQLPVNIIRIIDDTVYNYQSLVDKLDPLDRVLDPVYCTKLVKELCANISYAYLNEIQQRNGMRIPQHIQTATKLLQIALRSYLSTSYLLKKGVINHLLDIIVQKIVFQFKKSLIDAGSTVGILAAQCISEPMTQYVLDSKHRTGGQGGTKTNAIVRIQEILNVKDTLAMKNPHMMIMPKLEYETDKTKVQEIANHIEMMQFERFVTKTNIFFEEYGKPTHPDYQSEAKIIQQIERHNVGQKIPADLAKWCIRFTLDKEELILKSMKLETIVLAIRKAYPQVYLIYTPENADNLFIRCYLRNSMFKHTSQYYEDIVLPMMHKIKLVIVRGIKDIIATQVIDILKHIPNVDGSLELKKVYGIVTTGTNLTEVLQNAYIDPYRTQSDSLEEIERIFGIVAARNKIINEMKIALDGLNSIHCSIFADTMAMSGKVGSIQKTGLEQREMANVTLRLSFQTPVQIIQDAAINSMTDRISGISGNLIMGAMSVMGTTYNSVAVNEEFVKQNTSTIDNVLEEL
jgi:DNA-directed RNA polymerase beta' subunit